MKHLKEHPTINFERLVAFKVKIKKNVRHSNPKIAVRDLSNVKSLSFLTKGITPVELPPYCQNVVLKSTKAAQRQEVGITHKVIWTSETPRVGSFPKE